MSVESLAQRVAAIVIGTSAGGVEALSILLPALPPGLRAAVFVTLHLPRERPSLAVDIYQAKCRLPVREAEDKEPVQPGNVYFAPPDYHLLIEAGRQVALSVDDPVNYSRPSIDVLFETAALAYGKQLMGIILTGANEDGARGLAAIQRAGGVTVVQEPGSARESRMVVSALRQCAADFIMSLEDIAALLRTLA
jgi:two-component system chemotaxis response regulator CheB